MAVTIPPIILGAVDSQVLDQGLSTQVDLGGSTAGAMFTYKPSYFSLEIDQALGQIQRWRTKEELDYETTLVQSQTLLYTAAMSYPSSASVLLNAGTLATATAPTVTPGGVAGAVTYTYTVIAVNSNGDGIPSPTGTTATGNAVLSVANPNNLSWTAVPGAVGYKIQRTVGGGSAGIISGTLLVPQTTFSDIGIVATPYTASVANPVTPNTNTTTIGGTVNVPVRTLDVARPKNDGTLNHWRFHVWRVQSVDPVPFEFKRDKNSEYKVKMSALADPAHAYGVWTTAEES